MNRSSSGAILAAVCAAYVKDEKASINEFDDIIRAARNVMTGQGCKIKTIDKEASRAAGREERRRKKEQKERRQAYAKQYDIAEDPMSIGDHMWREMHKTLEDLSKKAEFADLTIDMVQRAGELRRKIGAAEPGAAE
jgi:hypothetical protein